MGGSGCGKSTLLRHLIGLMEPAKGEVLYETAELHHARRRADSGVLRRFGVLYQSGASVELDDACGERRACRSTNSPISAPAEIREVASLKLALVGLKGSRTSIRRRSAAACRSAPALARAMALDPDILFFDEPSAGLDPDQLAPARRPDPRVARQPRRDDRRGDARAASIFAIGNNCIFLDAESEPRSRRATRRNCWPTARTPR